jgi:hypothetical protein
MGAPAQKGIPVVPMEEILAMGEELGQAAGAKGATIVVKCDIEGAEAPLFRAMRRWEDRVHYVILELHTEFLPVAEFQACLEASRYHWRIDGTIAADAILAVVGLQRLGLKAASQSRRAASL